MYVCILSMKLLCCEMCTGWSRSTGSRGYNTERRRWSNDTLASAGVNKDFLLPSPLKKRHSPALFSLCFVASNWTLFLPMPISLQSIFIKLKLSEIETDCAWRISRNIPCKKIYQLSSKNHLHTNLANIGLLICARQFWNKCRWDRKAKREREAHTQHVSDEGAYFCFRELVFFPFSSDVFRGCFCPLYTSEEKGKKLVNGNKVCLASSETCCVCAFLSLDNFLEILHTQSVSFFNSF